MRMTIAFGVLLLIALALTWLLGTEMTTSRDQRDQIQKLTISLAEKSRREDFELQEKCALQTEKMFRELGYKPGGPALNQSHYNAKLNKCFMLVETINTTNHGTGFHYKFLIDAYEQRGYAEYEWMEDKGGKKFWEVPPVLCRLTASVGNVVVCKSEDEFLYISLEG